MEQHTETRAPIGMATHAPMRPGPLLILRRATRLFLRRSIYLGVRAAQALHQRAALIAIIALLLGASGWMAFQLWGPKTASAAALSSMPPSENVKNYIKGRTDFNAQLMWSSFSDDLQARRITKGETPDIMQAKADQEEQLGIKFLDYIYIGGLTLDDGDTMYFYSTKLMIAGENVDIPSTFLTTPDGKLKAIYAIDPIQLLPK
ncbi:hypothetical protein F8S13_09965 [Chloroflexia bacterium SDU3-3]|nr:hypothetical protein F8S13_09965 [Chloroflexia bacterium SDU3-3]